MILDKNVTLEFVIHVMLFSVIMMERFLWCSVDCDVFVASDCCGAVLVYLLCIYLLQIYLMFCLWEICCACLLLFVYLLIYIPCKKDSKELGGLPRNNSLKSYGDPRTPGK